MNGSKYLSTDVELVSMDDIDQKIGSKRSFEEIEVDPSDSGSSKKAKLSEDPAREEIIDLD